MNEKTNAAKRKIILDCDPGKDDAIAIFIALQIANLELLGVTTVAGNSSLENTTNNALRILHQAGRSDVRVYAGMSHPMTDPKPFAGTFHGADGLGGIPLKASPVPAGDAHAVHYLIDTIRNGTEPITIVAVGPLTNIAMALSLAPDIRSRIDELIVMGGAVTVPGNVSPCAEFNISVDPEAARYVLHAGLPVTMVGLDVTLKAKTDRSAIEAIRSLNTRVGSLVAEILDSYLGTYREQFGYDAAPIHDALAVAIASDPSLVQKKHLYVDVVVSDPLTRGKTVGDVWGMLGKDANAGVCIEVDNHRFQSLLREALAQYRQ